MTRLLPLLAAIFILFTACTAPRELGAPGNASAPVRKTESKADFPAGDEGGNVMAVFNDWLKLVEEKPQEAEKVYMELVKIAPESGWLRYDGALMYLKLNDARRAEEELTAALRYNAPPARVFNALGAIYFAGGRKAEAVGAFKRAYGAEASAAAMINLANAYQAVGKHEEALKHYRDAETLEPANHLLHYNIGVLYYRMGDYKKAREEFTKALPGGENDVKILFSEAQTLLKLGELEKALDIIRRMPGTGLSNPYFYKNRGIVHEIYIGDMDKAREDYSMYISLKKDKEVEAWLDTISSRAVKQDR